MLKDYLRRRREMGTSVRELVFEDCTGTSEDAHEFRELVDLVEW